MEYKRSPILETIEDVLKERSRQREIYSDFWNRMDDEILQDNEELHTVLTEEFLEAMVEFPKAMLNLTRVINDNGSTEEIRKELIHTAAVAVNWAEVLYDGK